MVAEEQDMQLVMLLQIKTHAPFISVYPLSQVVQVLPSQKRQFGMVDKQSVTQAVLSLFKVKLVMQAEQVLTVSQVAQYSMKQKEG